MSSSVGYAAADHFTLFLLPGRRPRRDPAVRTSDIQSWRPTCLLAVPEPRSPPPAPRSVRSAFSIFRMSIRIRYAGFLKSGSDPDIDPEVRWMGPSDRTGIVVLWPIEKHPLRVLTFAQGDISCIAENSAVQVFAVACRKRLTLD